MVRNAAALIEKRKTFEAGILALTACSSAQADGATTCALVAAAKRVLLLLKTRYTAPAFWKLGQAFFLALVPAAAADKEWLESALDACVRELAGDDDAEAAAAPRPAPSLFEGQLSAAATRSAAPAAPVSLVELLFGSGLENQQELEAALDASLEQQPRSTAPPAGRDAVRALRVETVTAERLKDAPSLRCAVCCFDFAPGDDAQTLPCNSSHAFHPPCLKPWLDAHNSCPTCRHELPTDDWRYEERKEKAAEAAVDKKGAAAAVRGGEFIYL